MADAIPLKAIFNPDGSVKTLAEFTVADSLPSLNGGTGVTNLGTVIGGNGVTVTDGAGAVIKSFTVTVDEADLIIAGQNLIGVVDGGTYS